jgi:uncharacterized damage-inducible protein DinB
MSGEVAIEFPAGSSDERRLLLNWLRFLRGAVLRKVVDLTDEQAHWQPDGALISLLGIVNHLTHVEWRWIDGGILGHSTDRSEAEFHPRPELTLVAAVAAYQRRAGATDTVIMQMPSLDVPCSMQTGTDLRWVVLHLINETARHAGHADAVRELLDGTTGE